MQLKIQTDYAIRILLYLSVANRTCSTKEISQAMKIAESYSPKIMKRLRDAEFIVSEVGKDGGYRLNKRPSEINLLSIMKITEDTIMFNRCLEEDGFCSRNAPAICAVHKVYASYQKMTEAYFTEFTLEKLLKEK